MSDDRNLVTVRNAGNDIIKAHKARTQYAEMAGGDRMKQNRIVVMRVIGILLLFLCGFPATVFAQTFRPVPLPTPSPFPASSVIYQWDYNCPNATAGSVCFSSLGFPAAAISLFLVEFPIGNSTILMTCYIANLTAQSATTGWNSSCIQATTGFNFSQRGMTLNYAGNPNAPPPTK
jgi:hypothetical protein